MMKNKTWMHAILYALCLALLLAQSHRIQQFEKADQEARRAEVRFAAEDRATTTALQTKLGTLQEQLIICTSAATAGAILPGKTAAIRK